MAISLKASYRQLILLCLAILLTNLNFANTGDDELFRIRRSKDANVIVYALNTDGNGQLNALSPVKIYWIKASNENRIEPLTWIQQRYAYGLHFSAVNKETAEMYFTAYNHRKLNLRKNEEGRYCVYVPTNQGEVPLTEIFIQIDGGSFWFPKVSRVELYTSKTNHQPLLAEVIIP